ncbi:NAD(P)H-dependent oxidoreductase [Leptospira sp. 2 VSF19]|uniref:NAD(P)H-dependent oxidoreductase n=1 Tax=Leptospira soteropolitanensis TaxID=2950025 RepID=A0AAW5VJ10_9LEPT|nr:NAD(P)H-dependent oxidoreductase [Leptospira soteropolitanensis]MCW7494288.1 NAD(P)H-dependent oxidoreductase [Leptospira soteropolitanensis]MCW7502003.1 NAD(P)H-dependent oxidoreductase [Leptospira soteropolitanensis]MCW7524134.1 NAD(P)H-dependent oxidoreductase [Leptospira soteropolitanensis]MCW7527999.1 NAD(P)H-dependent oxidoreductase [Leptospira soteropolitanensis]MCW7531853.1 NAD(P)H-dependent oxidoreductase [Leptospira soteropolitanensis]
MQTNRRNILVVLGHPNSNSLCAHLAETYVNEAKKVGHTVNFLKLGELKFDYNLHMGHKKESQQLLEPDLIQSQRLISESDHLVFVFPSWWASMPAVLKAWIDRVFLPGFSFKYRKNSPFPEKLLLGKTARIIVTMDAPSWYYKWFNKSPGVQLLKFGTLEFCGVSPVKVTIFGQVRTRKQRDFMKWTKLVESIAIEGK